jgi:hypothetical protein
MPCERISSSLFLLLVLVVPLAACSSARMVEGDSPDRFAVINRQAALQTAVVSLYDGRQEKARSLRITADSTSWIDPQSARVVSTATSNVVSVVFVSRGRGAFQGGGIGLAVGALSSGVSMAAAWEPCQSTEFLGCLFHPSSPGDAAVMGALVGGLGGAFWGALIGASIGSRRAYQIELAPVAQPPVALSSGAGSER